MNKKFEQLFAEKNNNLLSIYFTAGFPSLNDTTTVLNSLIKNGVDLIEIGIPYSDPLADGPAIQQSNQHAIESGMTLQVLFSQLKDENYKENKVPLILMGYLNPILQFGIEEFCKQAQNCGISGLIIPDLPITIYESKYAALFSKYELSFIILITPQTSDERVLKIDVLTTAFIYAVSSSSITGRQTQMEAKEAFWKKLSEMKLQHPILTGFGIHDRESFQAACRYTAGGIIGSAFIRALEKATSVEEATANFVSQIST